MTRPDWADEDTEDPDYGDLPEHPGRLLALLAVVVALLLAGAVWLSGWDGPEHLP